MKKILLLVSICISCSSCCTLFSSSKQDITFTGMNGTKIYEASTKQKIAEIKEELFNLRFQMATGQCENPMKIREVKKSIARIKTIQRQRELNA